MWQAQHNIEFSENHAEMSRPGQKVKAIQRLEQPAKLFSLILASAQALCDLDYKALSVYFLMAADSYCWFPETQINGFVKSTFSTAHISHPLGICLKVQASYVCSKRSVPKQTARKSVTWIFKVNWGAACKDMGGVRGKKYKVKSDFIGPSLA